MSILGELEQKKAPLVYFEVDVALAQHISVNRMYSVRGGARYLTTEGSKHKDLISSIVADAVIAWCGGSITQHVYMEGGYVELVLEFRFETIRNASWKPGTYTVSKKHATKKPSNPYKQMDTSNYVKLVEDAIAKGTGIDDSAHHITHLTRTEGPPGVFIAYTIWPPLS